jgi:hypothetical protein
MEKGDKMLQKVKCYFGFHKERWLGMELPYCQQVLMKCDCCGKYSLWHTGINAQTGWTKNLDKLPKIVKNHIIENKL